MLVDYHELKYKLIGLEVLKPTGGTLSGHAAGEPFDKLVYQEIKKIFPSQTFRQYEYLNDLYSKNPTVIGFSARQALFNSPSIMFLLSRGKDVTNKWSLDNLFEEKQNDTADILVVKDDFYEIIDIKTRNISKKSQPPNIISAYKLAQLCAIMIDNQEFDNFTINYVEIDWDLSGDKLTCVDVYFMDLFKIDPRELYINWVAAMQIQFHVSDMEQEFIFPKETWAKYYLKNFVAQAERRAKSMIDKFVTPFLKYIE